ncbi:hypothetical protein [Algoriphagus sp.]|uniref:hypothetical protein n=1 Tax=Algoriphagus sp. TaxID=1872435 RepID=UPI00260B8A1D|nr:hypothetical protein [Algoriphagus sp.]
MSFTTLLHISCQEDGGQDPSVIGCPKGKVCFELNGAEKQVDAVWYDINGQRTRVYYESGSGDSYENIEIDFYGSSPGNYSFVDQNWGAGDASFHYFRAGGTGGASGTSGTLEITAVGSTVSGSFSLSGVDSEGNSVQLTNGFINQVPAE